MQYYNSNNFDKLFQRLNLQSIFFINEFLPLHIKYKKIVPLEKNWICPKSLLSDLRYRLEKKENKKNMISIF